MLPSKNEDINKTKVILNLNSKFKEEFNPKFKE